MLEQQRELKVSKENSKQRTSRQNSFNYFLDVVYRRIMFVSCLALSIEMENNQ